MSIRSSLRSLLTSWRAEYSRHTTDCSYCYWSTTDFDPIMRRYELSQHEAAEHTPVALSELTGFPSAEETA